MEIGTRQMARARASAWARMRGCVDRFVGSGNGRNWCRCGGGVGMRSACCSGGGCEM